MNYKEIVGYPNYLIYEDGRVWSKRRQGCNGRLINLRLNNNGYIRVYLVRDGKMNCIYLHRLLALHFIPNPENKPCVDHKDGIRTNNNLSNLRWVTYNENNYNRKSAKGVCYDKSINKKRIKRWRAYWYVDGKFKSKYFATEEEAIQHRILMVEKYYDRPTLT